MFGKLKDKLKGALSIFSTKTEEQAEDIPQEEVDKVLAEAEEKKEVVDEPQEEVQEEEKKERKFPQVPKIPRDRVKITFFDHASTPDNDNNISTGWSDPSLSDSGIEECKKIKENVKDTHFDVIFTSDLARAVETVKLVWPDQEFIEDKRLRACNYGALNGKEKVDLTKHIFEPFEGGQSLKDVEEEVRLFLNEVYENHKGKSIAIVSHRGPKDALEVLLKRRSWSKVLASKTGSDLAGIEYEIKELVEPYVEETSMEEETSEETKEKPEIVPEEKQTEAQPEPEGTYDEEVYDDSERDELVADAEIEPREDAFMEGYEEAKEEEAEPVEEVSESVEEIEEQQEEVEETPTAEEIIEETREHYAEAEEAQKKDVPSTEELVEKTHEKFEPEDTQEQKFDSPDVPKVEEVVEEVSKADEPKEEHQPFAEQLVEEVSEEQEEKKEEETKGFFGKLKSSLFGKSEGEKVQEKTEEKVVEEVVEESQEKVPEKKLEETKEEIEEKEATEEVQEEKQGFFGKVKQSLTTKKISAEKFDELFWELELVLLENNVSVQVIEKMKSDLKEELVDKPLPRDVPAKIQEVLRNTLSEILSHEKVDLIANSTTKKPYVIAFFGVNGAGKTTSIAKLTQYFKNNGKSVVLAACDTFRAAAIQQLEEHADKLDVKIIKHDYGSDAAAVAYDAIKHAEKHDIDIVMIDTAGRLHSNTNLMAELEKIIRVTTPDLKLFVGESITGNDCIEQAQKFNELVEMDGAILTKADVDEKGGAPLSISYVIGKPILFLGVGQEYKDLEEFDKDVILKRLGF